MRFPHHHSGGRVAYKEQASQKQQVKIAGRGRAFKRVRSWESGVGKKKDCKPFQEAAMEKTRSKQREVRYGVTTGMVTIRNPRGFEDKNLKTCLLC